MQPNSKKIKFIIFLATLLVVSLLTLSIYLIVKIDVANSTIQKQEKQIEKLEQQINTANAYPSSFEIISNEV